VQIKVRDNGPYLIRGKFELIDADGNPYVFEGEDVVLCRCGGSATKPFCDGAHRTSDFSAGERAPSERVSP